MGESLSSGSNMDIIIVYYCDSGLRFARQVANY